ncbi:MAG: HAD family hydrolase [Acidimicrobiales bacterium]|jgi:putative hydrolase of the HAD superfamily
MSVRPSGAGAIRALLFDLGGVVIGFDFRRAFRIWADLAGCDPAELERRFSFDEAYEQHERGEIDAAGYFGALRRSLGLGLSDAQLIEGWNDIYLGVIPGMPALLSAANRHLPLYAFTNSNPTHREAWAGRFAQELSVFGSIFVSSDLGLRKPDPAAFAAVAARTGLQVFELLFFDDAPENVEGARVAGMPAVLVNSTADVLQALQRLGIEPPLGDEGCT